VQLGYTYAKGWLWRWSADPQNLERALALVQTGPGPGDSLPIAHTRLGQIYAYNQQRDQALAEGERAIALDPNNAESYGMQAEVLIIAGRPEEALHAAQQAMRLNPRYPHFYVTSLGVAYVLTGRYAEAITTFKEAIRRNPNDQGAHVYLANSYLAQWVFQLSTDSQALERASAAAQRAIALNDNLPGGHSTLGYIYIFQKQYELAIAEMERAIALDPHFSWGYTGLAVTLGCMGRREEALQMVEQALRSKPPPVVDELLANIGWAIAWPAA
jgi:tetratricopeptide (TPR) repeat protein